MRLLKYGFLLLSSLLLFTTPGLQAEWKNLNQLKVAILDLDSRVTGDDIDSITVTELIQTEFVERNVFNVVERSMLTKILNEQKFSISGLSQSDLIKIGELSGAQKIITGSISKLAGSYILILKGIDTSSGTVEVSEKAIIKNAGELLDAIPLLADQFIRKVKGEEPAGTQTIADINPTPTNPVTKQLQFKDRYEAKDAKRVLLQLTDDRKAVTGFWVAQNKSTRVPNVGASLIFTVNVNQTGRYRLQISYFHYIPEIGYDGSGLNYKGTLTLYVNGEKVKQLTFAKTPDGFKDLEEYVNLNENQNIITIKCTNADDADVTIDYIMVDFAG